MPGESRPVQARSGPGRTRRRRGDRLRRSPQRAGQMDRARPRGPVESPPQGRRAGWRSPRRRDEARHGTVARTCVLMEKASQCIRQYVLINFMFQPTLPARRRSDDARTDPEGVLGALSRRAGGPAAGRIGVTLAVGPPALTCSAGRRRPVVGRAPGPPISGRAPCRSRTRSAAWQRRQFDTSP